MGEIMLSVNIIIAVRNEGAWLRNTIKSIIETSEYPNYDIIVVDDNSTDGCCENLHDCTILKNGYEPGLAFARQYGHDNTKADLFFITDGHVNFSQGWLRELVELHKQNPNSFISCASAGILSMGIDERYSLKDFTFATPQFIKAIQTNIRTDVPTALYCPLKDSDFHQTCQIRTDLNLTTFWSNEQKEYELVYLNHELKLNPFDNCRNLGHILLLLHGSGYDIQPLPFYKFGHVPNKSYIRCSALLGASYLYPRTLFDRICKGWPKIGKFFFIEPYMSTCANLCEVPILYSTKATIAHNYNRPFRLRGESYLGQMGYGQEITLYITTDTMTELVFERILYRPVAEKYPDWVEELKQNLLEQRKLTDEEYISLYGLNAIFG
jgi:glycosyltransferase involved in cell wall biosynthesis